MQIKNQISLTRKILFWITLLVLFASDFGTGGLSSVGAQRMAVMSPAITMTNSYLLSDGQFVFGPNVGDFNLEIYFQTNAPHLLNYAGELYGHSKYFSVNPKIYLTLLEIHSHLVSVPDTELLKNPFGLNNGDFMDQIEYLSNTMSEAYYLHLYTYSALPISQRSLEPFITSSGVTINVAPETNAGTYAIIAGFVALNEKNMSLILDNSQPDGFYQTYIRLFENDNPLDETNHITIPGEVSALAAPADTLVAPVNALVAPDNLLQFPWLQGQSWFFGGVHSNSSGGSGTPYTNAAALDFGPGGVSWGSDTSAMWVVASASGIPTKTSNCGFSIVHGGGWETGYYHIENIQNFSGTINQNDKIGVIANTLAEATCAGGNASGPHVHFWLSHNGALTAIDGTLLSGWYVHAGRWEYDTDCNYMWFEKAGVKKCPNTNKVLSEAPPAPILVNSVLPTSRSIPVGTMATIFNTVINAGTTTASGITLSMNPAPAGTFVYQQTNCATNVIIGSVNPSLDLVPNGVLCYILSFTPSSTFAATNVHIRAQASNAPSTNLLTGINTWLLRSTAAACPDIIALTTTTDFHQIACSGANAFAVAFSNVGAAATGDITAVANTGSATLPLSISISETNPGTGAIIGDNVLQSLGAGENRTVAVFVTYNGCISFDPAANRIFIEFRDASNNVIGSTSTAVSTNR